MVLNLANTLLVLGCLYFGFTYGWSNYPALYLLILFALGMWSYHAATNEIKEKIKAEIELLQAQAEYYKRKKS